MSPNKPFKLLFLCTGNSARSIIAEYFLKFEGKGRFESYSAGAIPTGKVNPLALWVLKDRYGIDATGAKSKSWAKYMGVEFDFVITVCDHAREICPIWPGQPIIAHWSSPDPAALEGPEDKKQQLFVQVASQLTRRIELLCALPDQQLEPFQVQQIGTQAKLQGESSLPR